jgi:hypothetical protein
MIQRETFAAALAAALAAVCPPSASAGGFACEAQCIVVASAEYQVKILGSVSYDADLPRHEAYAELKKLCERRGEDAGYPYGASLVDNLWFRARRHYEKTTVTAGGTYARAEAAVGASSWWSLTEKGRRRQATRADARWAYARAEAGAYWHSLSQERDDRELEIWQLPSSEPSACHFNQAIDKGQIPYNGRLPVRG